MSEHDFTGSADQWEERVFRNADYFRVHRYYGQGGHDSCITATFPDALRTVGSARRDRPDARVLVYAVTASGRFTVLPEKQWARYLSL